MDYFMEMANKASTKLELYLKVSFQMENEKEKDWKSMQMGTDRKEFGVTINLSKGSLSTKVEVYSRVSGKETNLLRESSLTMGK